MSVAASFGLSLLGLFVLPVLVSGCLADGRGGVPWYEARRDPTGLASDPAITPEAVVEVLCRPCRLGNELRPIGDFNRIIARLAKFSRAEIRKMRRRIVAEPGPVGDRQAIVGYLSLAHGAEKPAVLAPVEMLALPAALAIAALLAVVCQTISRIFEELPRRRRNSQPTHASAESENVISVKITACQ